MENNMDKEVLLSVRELQQYFKMGKRELKAVDKVSFDVYKGEVFGLVGESGCGKTTTGRSIIRLYDITGGSVYYKGERICAGTRGYKDAIKKARKDFEEQKISKEELEATIAQNRAAMKAAVKDHKKWSRTKSKNQLTNEIQMIFQDPVSSLDPRMTVREIIAEGLIIRGIKDKKYIDEQVYKILETVGLVKEHATRYPHEFSGGQKQRIGIARAVIMNPKLIIADEPISALDVSIQAQVINLLHELSQKMGLTVLFIAHDLAVVKYFSDRIAVMYYGKIVELGTSDELFAHPFHPYTRSLLSAIPLPDPITEKNRQRIVYNPMLDHDYSAEGPSMREVYPGHYVLCNTEEFEKYQKEYQETAK
ncbi:MAG: ATP-binding cassette domain-containing protein [Clostridia bacterium]|jgi:oligopeptide transport system ATP-binding protein|nr:ATP-binding cassette domain-containing protein [Clostridia bacterium]MBO7246423.1 ATP-binding cassette domain-containing protein [Clostridia bacterium]